MKSYFNWYFKKKTYKINHGRYYMQVQVRLALEIKTGIVSNINSIATFIFQINVTKWMCLNEYWNLMTSSQVKGFRSQLYSRKPLGCEDGEKKIAVKNYFAKVEIWICKIWIILRIFDSLRTGVLLGNM